MDDRQEALVDAVRANPDEDPPRMVYADWLETTGHTSRAELIRLQVQHDALPSWDRKRVELELRARVILEECDDQLRADLPAVEGLTWGRWQRGFVGTVETAGPEAVSEHALSIERFAVRRLATSWPSVAEARLPAIPGVRSVSLLGEAEDDTSMNWLLQSPLVEQLDELDLFDTYLSDEDFATLVNAPELQKLRAFRIFTGMLSQDGLASLVSSPMRPQTLFLTSGFFPEDPPVGPRGAASLAAWPGLSEVVHLDLSGSVYRDDALRTILSDGHPAQLRTLTLNNGPLGASVDSHLTFAPLAEAHAHLRLDHLSVDLSNITTKDAERLADAPILSELKSLTYSHNGLIEPKVFQALLAADWWDGLEVIHAHHHGRAPAQVAALVARAPQRLHTLTLGPIHDPTLDMSALEGLVRLDLSGCAVIPRSLLARGALPRLLSFRAKPTNAQGPANKSAFARSEAGRRVLSLDVFREPTRNRLVAPVRRALRNLEGFPVLGDLAYL